MRRLVLLIFRSGVPGAAFGGRAALAAGTFGEFHKEFVANYRPSQKVLMVRATAKER